MAYLRRAENKRSSTKAELVALNSDLSSEVARLRNQVSDLTQQKEELTEALAREAVKHIITKLPEQPVDTGNMLNLKAKALALKLHAQTRVRNNDIEVYLHGGWNSVNTIAIPEYA